MTIIDKLQVVWERMEIDDDSLFVLMYKLGNSGITDLGI